MRYTDKVKEGCHFGYDQGNCRGGGRQPDDRIQRRQSCEGQSLSRNRKTHPGDYGKTPLCTQHGRQKTDLARFLRADKIAQHISRCGQWLFLLQTMRMHQMPSLNSALALAAAIPVLLHTPQCPMGVVASIISVEISLRTKDAVYSRRTTKLGDRLNVT